jgi:CheY-like chemotaxis protein
LIATLAQEHDLIVKEAGLNLRAYGGRHWVNADPHLITRILRNLIHNACTHSRGQRLRIFTRQMGDCVRLYIVDDGLGIGEAHESCFEPFVQGKIALSNAQGMGLGLAVSRDMAQLMGGRLDLDGRWRAGAAFFLELPTANRPQAIGVAPPMSKAGRKGLYGLKIIVIDNDTGARTALSELLSLLASDVRAVSSLAELSALRFEAPDLIVSDWHLGDGIHGDAAITLARGRWPEIAAIVVTGDGASQTLRAMSALNVPVLWKPIDIDALGVMAERVTAGDLVKGGLQREAAFV